VPTPETAVDLTDRQTDVLRLTREGKNPTEIGRELGISSQGVHGHLRKLREAGLVEPLAAPKRAPKRPAARDSGAPFDPQDTIRAVGQEITDQLDALASREQEIDATITELKDEKRRIGLARTELQKLVPTTP
jgi:predicted ArsR family transcriptional regulator